MCEGSTKDVAKGYVGKEMGYWKDDTRVGNVFVKISYVKVVEEDEKEIQRWKKMQMSNVQKTDVAVRFGWPSAKITAEDVYLGGDIHGNMLSIVHLEMLEWLSRRDLDVPSKNLSQKMAFFAPSVVANAFARISKMTDKDCRDAEIVDLAVQWRGKLNGKISAILPVWASDHWTLLLLSRKDPTSDVWTVDYKDSLATPSDACAHTAKKLLEIASAATGKHLELPPRSNRCTQPKMSGTCGYYVAHWIDAKMREIYHNEPEMSTGTPMLSAMKKRLLSMVQMAESSLKWVETHQEKMDAQVERDEREKKEAAQIEKAIKESLDMVEQVRQKTKLVVNEDTWDSKWGCPKCAWAKKGSTCCNPNKVRAKLDAEMLYGKKHGIPAEDGKHDKEVYNELYAKIRDKIMEKHADASKDFWVLPNLGKKDEPSAASKDTPSTSASASSKDAPAPSVKD